MRYSYYDIHTHLNFSAFEADREEVFALAREVGVGVINVGTQKDTSRSAVEFAEKHEGAWAVVGLHPIHTSASYHDEQELGDGGKAFTSRGETFDYDYYRKLALHPKVVAIGECGLDYYRSMEHEAWNMEQKKQREIFALQIELAKEVRKPLMLHIRNGSSISAYRDAYDILKDKGVLGNLHFFAGTIEEAKPFLDLGFSFSFTGVITFARSYDEVIRYLPLESIMSETDAPYVAPVPYRGKRNEPSYVVEVVRKIAEIRGEDAEKVREQFVKNTRSFFGLV
ncbi:MAG: TatD DNase family protein [Parcubacteria group bacterium Gr01-1014_72]|nr:MAG: TatD DNase family protein [Parcubacteria group bacterium Gr01-1014_72]